MLCAGRRAGKSRILATIATYLAFRSYEQYLAPGEVATIGIIAADRKQARSIYRFIQGLIQAIPELRSMVADETAEYMLLTNRVQIEVGTASFRSTRGYSYAAILCDEVAFWRTEETSVNVDEEILRALRPGMASIPGSVMLIASSPYAKKGELYASYRKYFGKDDADVLVWKSSTLAMHDTPKLRKQREQAFEKDPESAVAEWDAEFRSDLADFVNQETIDAVTCIGRRDLPPQPGVTYSAFADPSGGVSDSFCLAIGHLGPAAMCVLDFVLEIRAPFDPEAAVTECVHVLRRFSVTRVVSDRYAGLWPKARFQEHGIEYEQSARAKSDLYLDLLPLLNARRVELLENTRLAAQLVGLERRTARSGKDSVDHIRGGKDDLANVTAGVLVGLDLDRRPTVMKQNKLLNNGQPFAYPFHPLAIYVSLTASRTGETACVYFSKSRTDDAMYILDFDAGPFGGTLFQDAVARLHELAVLCGVPGTHLGVYTQPDLLLPLQNAGFHAESVPTSMLDSETLLFSVAQAVSENRVRMCANAVEKSKLHALPAALDYRIGDVNDDPIRRSVLWAVSLSFNTQY